MIKNKTTVPLTVVLFLSNLFFDLGCLTDSAAQIVQLSTSDLTGTNNVHLHNVRGVNGECLFDSATVRNASNGKGLGDSAAILGNYCAFEKLNSFAGTFLNAVVNTNRVTYVNGRYVLLELLICQNLNEIHYLGPP